MAHITADRVRDTSTSTGTGNFTVSGTAPTGFRTLSAVLSVGDTFYYAIQGQGTSEWEVGLGTYSSANVFARTTVLSSSNSGSAVSFSASTKDVFLTLAASKTIQTNASGIVDLPASSTINGVAAVTTAGSQTLTNKTLTNPTINGFTGDTSVINVGSGQVYKDTSGNVGVGTTSPSVKLEVNGTSYFGRSGTSYGFVGALSSGNNTNTGYFGFYTAAGTRQAYIGYIGAPNDALNIETDTTKPIRFAVNATEAMRIDSSGNVGIGTATPNANTGTALVLYSTNSPRFRLTNSTTGQAAGDGSEISLFSGGDLIIENRENAPTIFYNNGGERMRMSAAGVLSIGTTGTNGGGKFYCYDSTTTGAFIGGFRAASASYTSATQVNWNDKSSSTDNYYFVCRNNSDSNTAFSMRNDGNAYADGTWNNNGADYAEFFESLTGQPIDVGATVVLENNKVREATHQDPASAIIGVVRPKEPSKASMVVGNTAWNKWTDAYLTDDFGRYILEYHDVIEWDEVVEGENGSTQTVSHSYESHAIPDGIIVPSDAIVKTLNQKGQRFYHYKKNPDYDPSREYISREERPEWLIVGLIGQVPVLKGQPIGDRWIKMRDISSSVEEYMIR